MTILEQHLQNVVNRKQPAVGFFDQEQTFIAEYSVVAQTMESAMLEARRGKSGAHAHATSCPQLYFPTRGVKNIARTVLTVRTVMVTTAIGMLSRILGRAGSSYTSSSLYNNSPLPCTSYLRFQRAGRLATTSRLHAASAAQ